MDLPLTAPASPDANPPPAATSPQVGATPPPAEPRAGAMARKTLRRAAAALLVSIVVCLLVYLVLAVPGAWFPGASEKTFGPSDMTLTRGDGAVANGQWIIRGPDATGLTLLSAVTSFRSTDYAAIQWLAPDLPDQVSVRLLWRTDYAPEKLNSVPITVEAGRAAPTVLAKNPAWIGRITGLALAIQGNVPQPIRVSGVVAKPMGAMDVVRDRLREWFAFEGWTGASINTITGGSDVQDLPLPLLLAAALALAGTAAIAFERLRPGALGASVPLLLGAMFVLAWLVLDARWTINLTRQEHATFTRYGGKDLAARHASAEDGPLFAFIEHARKVLPSSPVRIFVASDADYFRGRAAYHLYPHSVFFDPRRNWLPGAQDMKPGDWLLVFQRRGIQYDPARQMLRWEGQTRSAELKFVEPGGALFLIR